jgi:hypothetical protein
MSAGSPETSLGATRGPRDALEFRPAWISSAGSNSSHAQLGGRGDGADDRTTADTDPPRLP